MPATADPSSSLASLADLPDADRYAVSLQLIARRGEAWILEDDRWPFLLVDDGGRPCLALWPHPALARAAIPAEPTGYRAQAIDLELLLERWLPGLEQEGMRIAVCPTSDHTGLAVHPSKLAQDLGGAPV